MRAMPRTRLLVSSLVLISLLVVFAPARAMAGDESPNTIVLILFDALRADHTGVYGYDKPTTPTLDALAREGTRYTRMYVNAPWTRPSTTSFLTGYHASRHRNETDRSKLKARVTSLAQRLKKAGYTTAGFTANGNGGSLAGLEKGFDLFEDTTRTYKKKMRGKTYCCNGLPTGEFLVRRVEKWLDTPQAKKAKKKFIFLFFVDPHDPYGAPPELEEMFLGPEFKGEPRRKASWEYKNDYPERERRSLIALYDAGIRYADQATGQLLAHFERRKLREDAAIFVTADHGEGFGEHDFYLHAHHFWEEVVHVPLIAVGPGFAKNRVDERLAQSIDVTRTIAELAGADPGDLPGYDLRHGAAASHIISEYNEFGIKRQAVIGERYKVVWQRPADETWYLRAARYKKYFPSVSFGKEVVRVFDLQADPKEKNELKGKMPPEAKALLEKLRAFVEESERLDPARDLHVTN